MDRDVAGLRVLPEQVHYSAPSISGIRISVTIKSGTRRWVIVRFEPPGAAFVAGKGGHAGGERVAEMWYKEAVADALLTGLDQVAAFCSESCAWTFEIDIHQGRFQFLRSGL